MRFIFKTDYAQDINLAKHGGHVGWYSALICALILSPWLLDDYWLAQLTLILIYSIVGLGLMLLAGFTGQFSLGHAAFLGIGAYTQAVAINAGLPLIVALVGAMAFAALIGVIVAIPALRVRGVFLGMATLALGIILEEAFARWESVTGGNAGLFVQSPTLFGFEINEATPYYFLCLILTILVTLGVANLLRSPTGRAFVAIRDSEISAQSMGIPLARYKTLAFAISAALTGLGGALYAHKIQFLTPEQFGIIQSIDLLLLIVIGGLGSIHGAFLGAIFLITMPQIISIGKDYLPAGIGESPGLSAMVYGVVLVLFVLFEPLGLYGRWLKVRAYIQLFPLYRRGMFERQKSFQKSERLK